MTQYYLKKTKKIAAILYSGDNIEEIKQFVGNGDITLEIGPARTLIIKYKESCFLRTIPVGRYILKGDHKTFSCLSVDAFNRQYVRYDEGKSTDLKE